MAEQDSLKVYWEHFFKAETGAYEKSTWLDLFLAEFLIRVNNGADPKELINFCPVSGVVSLVGCELLCGIHRVTSSITAHCAPLVHDATSPVSTSCSGKTDVKAEESEVKPEDPRLTAPSALTRATAQSSQEILRQYLLKGTAWKCLLLLRALGVEGLSCCRQLSSVLQWVYGEVRDAPPRAPAPPALPPLLPRTPIHQLFSLKIWSKQKLSGAQGSKSNSNVSSEKSSATGRSRHSTQQKPESDSKVKRKQSKHSEQSSDSGDSNDLQILNRSLTVKVCTSNDDFEYFNSPLRSSTEYPNETLYSDPFYTPRKGKPKAADYMNDKHKEIINSEISTFEFTLLITDLLIELCKTESSLSGTEGSQISVQCINFSLRNLCSLQFGSVPPAAHCDGLEVSRIKLALTELLIVSLDKVLVHSDLCAKLINNGILPMLLRILEDVVCKSSGKYDSEEENRAKDDKLNKTESDNLLKFVFGVAYSVTAFFHCLLMQCRSIDKLRAFTDQFKLYGECLKGGLLRECIELMVRIPADEEEKITLAKKLIESVGKLIVGMKRVRSEVVHGAACPRGKHKACRGRLAAGRHHHHHVLGDAGTASPLHAPCCVAVLYGTLTALLTDDAVAAHSLLRNKVLRTMLGSGVCCCFSPGFLMESIVRLMLTHNSVATLCLQVLEHTVYGELGASVLLPKVTDQLPCSICEPNEDKRDLVRKYCPHGVGPVERKSVWSFLIHYNSLLQLDNHNNVLHATVSHLLRVTPKCRTEMKYELLFSVIYPTFIVAKHRYVIRMEEAAYFLTVSCLNIFASLLNTVSFAEQFIQKGGLSYVLELVSLSEFSNQCCSILEIAIIVEIFKLMKESSKIAYYREISSLASVQMLFKSLSEMTEKCYKIYKLKLPTEKFEELCNVVKEREALLFQQEPQNTSPRKMSMPRAIKTPYASSENVLEESVEDFLEILKNVWTFWKSCAGLCLYSPLFRQYIVSESVFVDSYAMMKVLLYYLCNYECSPAEMRLVIKIVEALLTVQFAVTDVTSGRSKETSCSVLRAALDDEKVLSHDAALRALCEALIRVSVARPSRCHAMPAHTHAKVPPLGCESGASSPAGSSSEDSASGPYASEHSEPTRQDTGYEADVDICKLELLSLQKSKKSSVVNNICDYGALSSMEIECPEYHKQGELAHPELCVIVVDILTQLIHKLLSSPQESLSVGAGLATASLARACCTRLAGALGALDAAPPLLLSRLLAPPAARLLATTHPQLQELQSSILELIHVVASQNISAPELAALLKLFTADTPPLGALLSALQRLFDTATVATPDCILSFPIDLDHTDRKQFADELNYVMVNPATSQSQRAENMARKLHESHLKLGICSPWSVGAVRCGAEGAGWAAWLQGLGALLWLRTAPAGGATRRRGCDTNDDWQSESHDSEVKSPKKEPPMSARPTELSHVLSVGHDALMLELWLDVHTGSLIIRLTRPEQSCNKLVSEGRLWAALPPHRWACLALNVTEQVHKRRIHIQVTVFVNGCEIETLSLPLQGILVRKVTPTLVVAGHASRPGADPVGAYHLSHVQLYRAPLFTVYTALHLTAHCPDHSCQVRCESPNYPLVLTPEVLDCDIDWDQVYEISTATLRELHDNLLLTFSAHAPNIMNLYHQTVSLPSVFAGRVSSTASLTSGTGGGSSSVPETLYVTWTGRPLSSSHRGLAPQLYLLGGTDPLLYLFARVVELEAPAEQQAIALSLVLRASQSDQRLYAALYEPHAHSLHMIHTVLGSHKCKVSHHMLKVILETACRGSVLTSSGGAVVVLARSDAVLVEPRLLTLLMRSWRQLTQAPEVRWEVEGPNSTRSSESGSLWALTLRCMCALLRDHHPRQAFNLYQVTRVHLLRTLLAACKERFLNSDCGPLDAAASSSLVELVRGLMGSPPQLDRVVLLCDFLLLMHQASDTFVTHSRANFYFLLTSETQESSEFTLKRRPSRRRPNDVTSSSSVTSDDLESLAKDDDRRDSTESTKQMKGIINSQIREGRKHNVSSTSENSDATLERSAERDSGLEQDKAEGGEGDATDGPRAELLDDEFVLVEDDDLKHTTVGMYSSGIYHQRKVRAGAEHGWSACEGLLLLLRDTIQVLPEQALAQAVNGAIQAEVLIVLGNHRSARVRAALVRAVAALARRANADLAKKFKANHYYVHLANQISLYPPSWELAAACAALLTKCDVPLEDQLDEDVWTDLCEEAALRSPPLLALLPACVNDIPLAHNISRILARLIDKCPLKPLMEVSTAEAVVCALRAVGALPPRDGRDLLLADLQQLLHAILLKAAAHTHTLQYITDIHHMLTYIEWSGPPSVARAARDAQIALFHSQLDLLEDRLHTSYSAHTKYTNYFTTVLSSAVSLGSDAVSRGERTELASRHLSTVVRAVNFLLTLPPSEPLDSEASLVERLFATLLPAASGTGSRPKWWAGGGEWCGALQELWSWAAAPAAGARALQPALLRQLYRAPAPALHALAPNDPSHQRKLAVYLLCMLQHIHWAAEAGATPDPVELAITDWARSWAVSTQAELPERLPSHALNTEADRLLRADLQRWAKATPKMRPSIAKVVFSKETLCRTLTESAMSMTRGVVETQNAERKAFIDSLRRAHSAAAAANQRWAALVDTHTHERAIWHDPRSYPQSWELDATEGPGRVRVRLRRAHLDIHPRFLKPEQRHKLKSIHRGGGIHSVVSGSSGNRGGLVARLQLNETVGYMAGVVYVTVDSDTAGELLLSDRCIHFVPEDMEESEETKDSRVEHRSVAQSWPLEAVTQVATRRWCLQERAVELFLSSGHAHLIAFADVTERTAFLKALSNCHLPNRTEPDTLQEAMTQWRNGQITNWEYLMRLNSLAGRTYNDLMQYPVLPFVLADYTSRILDLNNPTSFRDLTKPMAIQNKNREQHYINTYNDLKLARREGCSALVSRAPHHYASLYSNSGGVLHYLVRLPPFTQLFLNYQDNNFDMPDRTFHSLATTWRLITNDSPTDVKELIPELYYLPELFYNNEGLNLGVRQCGAGVDSVELPGWAADARLFTLIHRQALEAPLVAETLPHWIDLVFGYKQTGQAAIDAINVFPACTYYGFDPMSLEDELDRTAAAAMVRTYGQAPRQLLKAPHPHRASDLVAQSGDQSGPEVSSGVSGARWGRYCGSPALPPAAAAARRGAAAAGAALQPLPHPRAVAVTTANTALLATPGDSSTPSNGGTSPGSVALVSWGHSDNIVRLKRRRDAPPDLLLHVPALDPITCVRTSCVQSGCGHPIFFGHLSGRVSVCRVRPAPGGGIRARVSTLHAHTAAITDMHVSARAGLLATVSVDGSIVLWDLNKLSYIRTLPNRDMLPVTLVTISETLCDVATVHDPATRRDTTDATHGRHDTQPIDEDSDSYEKDATYKYKSLVRVHTVNARFVGSVKVADRVTSICYSGVEEGTGVNCVACGLEGGGVRLYSSWDLRLVAVIPPADTTLPLISLTYSSDSSVLFGGYSDGAVVAWEAGAGGKAAPRILPAHALF